MRVIDSKYIIKNCPFCDGQGKLHKMAGNAFLVACSNPACKAEQIILGSEEAAVQMWNKRPTTSERPKGEWKYTDEVHEIARCSKCSFLIDASGCVDPEEYISTFRYCPYCGADMRREEQNT